MPYHMSYINIADTLTIDSCGFILAGHCFPPLFYALIFFLPIWDRVRVTFCEYVFVYKLFCYICYVIIGLFLVQLQYKIIMIFFFWWDTLHVFFIIFRVRIEKKLSFEILRLLHPTIILYSRLPIFMYFS